MDDIKIYLKFGMTILAAMAGIATFFIVYFWILKDVKHKKRIFNKVIYSFGYAFLVFNIIANYELAFPFVGPCVMIKLAELSDKVTIEELKLDNSETEEVSGITETK